MTNIIIVWHNFAKILYTDKRGAIFMPHSYVVVQCVNCKVKRPLNKGQGYSFWYQSISHIRRPVGSHYSNFCSRTHRLSTLHNATDKRRQTATDGRNTVA